MLLALQVQGHLFVVVVALVALAVVALDAGRSSTALAAAIKGVDAEAKSQGEATSVVPANGDGGSESNTNDSAKKDHTNIPGLYDATPVVAHLHKSNINVILNSRQNWLVEFYLSWCGHCQTFAPKWVQVAQRMKNWKPAVYVGAINCGDTLNAPTCKMFNITEYPTLKFFPRGSSVDKAIDFDENLKVHEMAEKVIDLASFSKEEAAFLSTTYTARQIDASVANSNVPTIVLIAPAVDKVAIAIAMHFWSRKEEVQVMFGEIEEDDECRIDVRQAHGGPGKVWSCKKGEMVEDHEDIAGFLIDKINTELGLSDASSGGGDASASKDSNALLGLLQTKKRALYYTHPHPTDILLTLSHILSVEFPSHTTHSLEDISAVETIVSLSSTLALGGPARQTLARIASFLRGRSTLNCRQFKNFMSRNLLVKPHIDWAHCRGSAPQYRGYPCGLWTLFHALVTKATTMGAEPPRHALSAIQHYVERFFSCRDCAAHFMSATQLIHENPSFSNEVKARPILNLWAVHNIANARIGQDETDKSTDPTFPKHFFPSKAQCPDCYTSGDEWSFESAAWDYDHLNMYLMSFYLPFERPAIADVVVNPSDHLAQVVDGAGKAEVVEGVEVHEQAHEVVKRGVDDHKGWVEGETRARHSFNIFLLVSGVGIVMVLIVHRIRQRQRRSVMMRKVR